MNAMKNLCWAVSGFLGVLLLTLSLGCGTQKTTAPDTQPREAAVAPTAAETTEEQATEEQVMEAQGGQAATAQESPAPPPAKAAEEAEAAPSAAPAKEPEQEEPPKAEEPKAEEPKAEAKAEEATAELPKIPLGLPPLLIPVDNPMTPEKVELGKMLYFDKRVSKDGTISCATCHNPQEAWTERKATSVGIHGQKGERNSPTVINAAYAAAQFWDGREPTLEAQATGPVENPIEMGNTMEAVVATLSKIPEYEERFQKVFGTGVTEEGFAKAIAAFERTVLSGNSPYDRYKNGDENALTEAQKRGLDLFEGTGCADCHRPPLFSTYEYYNASVGMDREKPDIGRQAVTGRAGDLGKFRVPSLREVANTGPYFHDGSAATLEEAVALMAGGGKDNPRLSPKLKAMRDAELTEQDQKDIVEFLKALSGEYPIIEEPELP